MCKTKKKSYFYFAWKRFLAWGKYTDIDTPLFFLLKRIITFVFECSKQLFQSDVFFDINYLRIIIAKEISFFFSSKFEEPLLNFHVQKRNVDSTDFFRVRTISVLELKYGYRPPPPFTIENVNNIRGLWCMLFCILMFKATLFYVFFFNMIFLRIIMIDVNKNKIWIFGKLYWIFMCKK